VIGDGVGADTVRLNAANQIDPTAEVTINSSGVLDLNNNSTSTGDLTLNGGSVTTGILISSRQVQELPLPEGAVFTLALQSPGVVYTGDPNFQGPTSNGNLAGFRTDGAAGNVINLDGSPDLGALLRRKRVAVFDAAQLAAQPLHRPPMRPGTLCVGLGCRRPCPKDAGR